MKWKHKYGIARLWQKGRAEERALELMYGGLRETSKAQTYTVYKGRIR